MILLLSADNTVSLGNNCLFQCRKVFALAHTHTHTHRQINCIAPTTMHCLHLYIYTKTSSCRHWRLNANAWDTATTGDTPNRRLLQHNRLILYSNCFPVVLLWLLLLLLLYAANCWIPETFHSYYSRIMLVPFRVKWKLLLLCFHFHRSCICHLLLCFPLCCYRYSDCCSTLSHHRRRYVSFVSITTLLLL